MKQVTLENMFTGTNIMKINIDKDGIITSEGVIVVQHLENQMRLKDFKDKCVGNDLDGDFEISKST